MTNTNGLHLLTYLLTYVHTYYLDNLEQRKGIEKVVGAHHVQLMDGTLIEDVDVIFMCTGYHYSFPFLDQSCQVNINNRVVSLSTNTY